MPVFLNIRYPDHLRPCGETTSIRSMFKSINQELASDGDCKEERQPGPTPLGRHLVRKGLWTQELLSAFVLCCLVLFAAVHHLTDGAKPSLNMPPSFFISVLAVLAGTVVVMVKPLSHVQLCTTPWTVAHQAPLSMGILQTILEWVAMPSSRGSSRPRDRTWLSCTAGRFFTTESPGKEEEQSTEQVCVGCSGGRFSAPLIPSFLVSAGSPNLHIPRL